MRDKSFSFLLVLLLSLMIPVVASAQHEQQTPAPTSATSTSPAPTTRAAPAVRATPQTPLDVQFEQMARLVDRIYDDFQELRTIDDPAELQRAMQKHSLMLDELRAMIIDHRALMYSHRPAPSKPKKSGGEAAHGPH